MNKPDSKVRDIPSNSQLLRIAVIGESNSGKSALVNSIVGRKVSICSGVGHAVKYTSLGITTHNDRQLVFYDSPAAIINKNGCNVWNSINDADYALLVVDAYRSRGSIRPVVGQLIDIVEEIKIPASLVINQIDRVKKDSALLESVNDRLSKRYGRFQSVHYTCSVRRREGIEDLRRSLLDACVPGRWLYQRGINSKFSEIELLCNLVKEKILVVTHERKLPFWAGPIIDVSNIGYTETGVDSTVRLDFRINLPTEKLFRDLKASNFDVFEIVAKYAMSELRQRQSESRFNMVLHIDHRDVIGKNGKIDYGKGRT